MFKSEEDFFNDYYSKVFSNFLSEESKNQIYITTETARTHSLKEGSYILPNNFGEVILRKVVSSNIEVNKKAEEIRDRLPSLYSEGVKKEDIVSWWNGIDAMRRAIVLDHEITLEAKLERSLASLKVSGNDNAMARYYVLRALRYSFPFFTYKVNEEIDGFRWLPWELYPRVNKFIMNMQKSGKDLQKMCVSSDTTLNDLFREQIIKGII